MRTEHTTHEPTSSRAREPRRRGGHVSLFRVAACAAVFVMAALAIPAAQKMTPEELVKLHLQAVTAGVPVPREQARDVKGTVAAVTPARAAGLLPGTFRLTSGATSARLNHALRYRSL